MITYIIRRILIFIPTILAISLIAFLISVSAPGDPVERLINASDNSGAMGSSLATNEKQKQELREKLGLNLPLFYFKLGTLSDPDTLYKVPDKNQRATLKRLTRTYGNWPKVEGYYESLKKAVYAHSIARNDSSAFKQYNPNEVNDAINTSNFNILSLLELSEDKVITAKMDSLERIFAKYSFLDPVARRFSDAQRAYLDMITHSTKWKTYIPNFIFYGLDNQYHQWLSGIILHGDFGISYQDQQPIIDRIGERFGWSFTLTILSVILAYLISIPIGIYSAYKRDKWFDRTSSVVLFVLYSLPNFFIGTLLLVLFANPDFLSWFPSSGVLDPSTFDPEWPWYRKVQHYAPYMVLPLITYTYSSFAFLSRQMRVAMMEVINQDFIRTARAKGLNESKVILKHALRNALLPIITVFANIFPLAIGGSVIIETIFSIPGMGLEIFQSILNYDYPMIVAVFTIVGFLTMLGYLVADILYAIVDPRISYK